MKWHVENARKAVGALHGSLSAQKPPKSARAAGLFASLLTALLAVLEALDGLRDALSSDDDDDEEPDTPQEVPPRP